MSRTIQTARARLVPKAAKLRRAWITAACFCGTRMFSNWSDDELVIPDYSQWTRRDLEAEVQRLKASIAVAFGAFMEPLDFDAAVDRFAEWSNLLTDDEPSVLASVAEFERDVGLLAPLREHLEAPPYAHLVLQGAWGVAVRHPEWHLAGDVACLLRLYREALAHQRTKRQRGHRTVDTEAAQTLARAVVVACFNLLEGFTLGLAHAHVMTAAVEPRQRKKLLNVHGPLEKRIESIPATIKGVELGTEGRSAILDGQAHAFIFGHVKNYRDSFVHCVPGRGAVKQGYIREDLFHTEDAEPLVERAVEQTVALIQSIWRSVHGRDGPRWLDRATQSSRS